MNNLNIRKNDNVIVLTGKDKGKKGKVLGADPKNETLTVEGVNIITKHVKARRQGEVGGIQKEPGNIHVSNVMIICPSCGKPTRVAHAINEKGEKARICKKCGASLDVEVKAAKKAAKSKAKEDVKPEAEKPAKAKKATKKSAKAEE